MAVAAVCALRTTLSVNRPFNALRRKNLFNDLIRMIGRAVVDTDNFDFTFVGLPFDEARTNGSSVLVEENRDDRYARAPHALIPGEQSVPHAAAFQWSDRERWLAISARRFSDSWIGDKHHVAGTIVLRRASMTRSGSTSLSNRASALGSHGTIFNESGAPRYAVGTLSENALWAIPVISSD